MDGGGGGGGGDGRWRDGVAMGDSDGGGTIAMGNGGGAMNGGTASRLRCTAAQCAAGRQRERQRNRVGRRRDKTLLILEVRHGVGIASIFGEKRPILCVTEKKHQNSNPHIGTRTPRIGMGRDMSIFQIGESP
jgi:hypothetical protein